MTSFMEIHMGLFVVVHKKHLNLQIECCKLTCKLSKLFRYCYPESKALLYLFINSQDYKLTDLLRVQMCLRKMCTCMCLCMHSLSMHTCITSFRVQ